MVQAAVLSGGLSLVTFVALNPFLTARPTPAPRAEVAAIAKLGLARRAWLLVEHRMAVSKGQMDIFPHNALTTPLEKLSDDRRPGVRPVRAVRPVTTPIPRSGTTGRRTGAADLAPLRARGAFWAWGHGRRQLRVGEPPTALGDPGRGRSRPGRRVGVPPAGLGPLFPVAPARLGLAGGGGHGGGGRAPGAVFPQREGV